MIHCELRSGNRHPGAGGTGFLRPSAVSADGAEWMFYEHTQLGCISGDEEIEKEGEVAASAHPIRHPPDDLLS